MIYVVVLPYAMLTTGTWSGRRSSPKRGRPCGSGRRTVWMAHIDNLLLEIGDLFFKVDSRVLLASDEGDECGVVLDCQCREAVSGDRGFGGFGRGGRGKRFA